MPRPALVMMEEETFMLEIINLCHVLDRWTDLTRK